ncbi:MAG: hypothetical protein K2L21_03455 [Muribaculaceae bacterium]|nr:hypothetical protein [Muribaculaceae bacterium]
MKKKFSTLALALIAAAGIGVMAQNNTTAPDCCKKGHKDNCDKKELPCMDRAQADSLEATVLFDGIQLNADQQAKIKQLRADKAKARMEARKAEKDARAEFGKGRMKARKAEMKADLEKMKQILTPEQYVKYLENMVTSAPRHHGMDAKAPRHGHKDMKAASARPEKNKGMHKQHRPEKNTGRAGK